MNSPHDYYVEGNRKRCRICRRLNSQAYYARKWPDGKPRPRTLHPERHYRWAARTWHEMSEADQQLLKIAFGLDRPIERLAA